MADTVFQMLNARDSEVHVLAPAWSLPVLERIPSITKGHALAAGHGELAWRARRQLGFTLRPLDFDQAIVLPRSLKSALVPWFAKIPRRTGFRGEMRFGLLNDIRPFDPNILNQTVKRFAALALESGASLPEQLPQPKLLVDANAQALVHERFDLESDRPSVVLMPGAEYGPAKCWPLTHFRTLAERLLNEGMQVLVLGSSRDRPGAEGITSGLAARNLCGETSLAEAIDLTALARVAVSNDSGLMHVAAALGTHVIALYGSTTPDFTPPLTEKATLFQRDLPCRPCFKRTCPLGHLDCLQGIEPAAVAGAVQRVVASA